MAVAINQTFTLVPERAVAASWALLLHVVLAAIAMVGLSQTIIPPEAHGGFEVVDLSAYGAFQPSPTAVKPASEPTNDPQPHVKEEPEVPPVTEPEKADLPDPTPITTEPPKVLPATKTPVLAMKPKQKPKPPAPHRPDPITPKKEALKDPLPPQPKSPESVVSSNAGEAAYVPPDSQAAYLRNPKPSYPKMARLRGLEGVVLLAVEVSSEGAVRRLHVKKSSGHKILDSAALYTVKRWRFSPATRENKKVSAVVDVPIRFKLNDKPKGAV